MFDSRNPVYCLGAVENYGNPLIGRFVTIAWSPEKEYYARGVGGYNELEYKTATDAIDALKMLKVLEPGKWENFAAVLKTW